MVEIWLKSSKANRSKQPQDTVFGQPLAVCPVLALTNYLQIRPFLRGLLFIKLDGQAAHYNDLFNIICKLARFLQLPDQFIKPHSLWIGGMTHLYLLGVLVEQIQRLSCWLSEVFKKYIHV